MKVARNAFHAEEWRARDEIVELRNKLDSNEPKDRKVAAKRVVDIMRSGGDVGTLFSSMLRCVKTNDMELKRLVYLYIINYATREPEQAIMAVNTFIQDSQHENPLVRAMAIRTMSRIRIESVAENLVIPLKKRFDDESPYVRKTVALAVAKLYSIIPDTVENAGLFDLLIRMLEDENPMVVSNTTAAILEINQLRDEPVFAFHGKSVTPIVNAIVNSNEWCQCILFDALAKHEPESQEAAAMLIDRLTPLLKHANPGVVIGAFKCIFLFMDYDGRLPKDVFPHVLPPFLSLVSGAPPEIQFVVLRTLSLFVQKYPKALAKDVRIFFCKYNDPSYVKVQKLDIITANTTAANASLVLDELAEYCDAIDIGFVKKAVACIGDIALKLESCARRCVDILVKLVDGKAVYAVEQSVIVLADILRKFPGHFEGVIGKVCQNGGELKDTDAKVAFLWILGEYSGLIENVDILIDPFLDTFQDEAPLVQIQIISTVVKVYIDKKEKISDMLQFVLSEATKDTMLPDVRNRALIYWRMLSMSSDITKELVDFPKRGVELSSKTFSEDVLQELMGNMGFVSGVLHIVPSKLAHKFRHRSMEDEINSADRSWKPLAILNDPGIVALCSDWSSKYYFLQITNKSETPIKGLALAVDTNGSGFEIGQAIAFPEVLNPTESCELAIGYNFNPAAMRSAASPSQLSFALKTSEGVQIYKDTIDTRRITKGIPRMKKTEFLSFFESHPDSLIFDIPSGTLAADEELAERRIQIVARRENEVCLSFALGADISFICDLELQPGNIHAIIKGDKSLFPLLRECAQYTFGID